MFCAIVEKLPQKLSGRNNSIKPINPLQLTFLILLQSGVCHLPSLARGQLTICVVRSQTGLKSDERRRDLAKRKRDSQKDLEKAPLWPSVNLQALLLIIIWWKTGFFWERERLNWYIDHTAKSPLIEEFSSQIRARITLFSRALPFSRWEIDNSRLFP